MFKLNQQIFSRQKKNTPTSGYCERREFTSLLQESRKRIQNHSIENMKKQPMRQIYFETTLDAFTNFFLGGKILNRTKTNW